VAERSYSQIIFHIIRSSNPCYFLQTGKKRSNKCMQRCYFNASKIKSCCFSFFF